MCTTHELVTIAFLVLALNRGAVSTNGGASDVPPVSRSDDDGDSS